MPTHRFKNCGHVGDYESSEFRLRLKFMRSIGQNCEFSNSLSEGSFNGCILLLCGLCAGVDTKCEIFTFGSCRGRSVK